MIIRLKDILEENNQSIAIEESLDGFEYNGIEISAVNAAGRVWIDSNLIRIKLAGEYAFIAQCDRCLEEIRRDEHFEFEQEEAIDKLEDGEIDTEEILTENILLNMPNKVLCRTDCLGLCPDCGMNLNKGKCSCAENRINPQFAALEKLLEGKGKNLGGE